LYVLNTNVFFSWGPTDEEIDQALNRFWKAPSAQPNQDVWVTLNLLSKGATLSVFDPAPDASKRTCLAKFDFPLKEPVVPLNLVFRPHPHPAWRTWLNWLFAPFRLRLSTMS
jgi:hypothetical protein